MWLACEERLYNYFAVIKNIQRLTLAYIIRNTPAPPGIGIDREQDTIQNSPIQGNMFSCDTKKVVAILNELTVDTDDKTWMKGKLYGIEAILALQNHYDSKSDGERRIKLAKDDLKRLFYRNETTFSFERYVTKMKQKKYDREIKCSPI